MKHRPGAREYKLSTIFWCVGVVLSCPDGYFRFVSTHEQPAVPAAEHDGAPAAMPACFPGGQRPELPGHLLQAIADAPPLTPEDAAMVRALLHAGAPQVPAAMQPAA